MTYGRTILNYDYELHSPTVVTTEEIQNFMHRMNIYESFISSKCIILLSFTPFMWILFHEGETRRWPRSKNTRRSVL